MRISAAISRAGDRILALLVRWAFGPIGAILPFRCCGPIARPLAWIAWSAGFRRHVITRNLELAFPELGDAERERLGRASLISLFTVLLEMLAIGHLTDRQLERALQVDDPAWIARTTSDGGVLLSGHLGNWELLAVGAAARSRVPFSVVVKDQRHGEPIQAMRTSRGNEVLPTGRGARASAAVLARRGVVAMLADQAAPEQEPALPMFGIPTNTYSAPARLALRFGVPVVVGFAIRVAPGRYRLDVHQIPTDDLADTEDGAVRLTERYVAVLEEAIRRYPEQWVWAHRKWKNTPGITYVEQPA